MHLQNHPAVIIDRAFARSAQARTGCNNWGDPGFVGRLARWRDVIARDSGLNARGRTQAEAMTLLHACNRLRLEALIAKHPEIEQIELEPPIVVTGLPRSGTTSLARKLSPGHRWLRYWETINPISGRVEARRMSQAVQQFIPELFKLHDCREDAFADDTELQCLAFGSYALEWHAHVPDWRDAYLATDQTSVYRYLKRAMQALSFLRGPTDWVIKSPQHLEQLPVIANVFPGARLIVTMREPAAALQSMGRVMAAMERAFRRSPYPRTYWSDRFNGMVARYEADRHLFPNRVELDFEHWTLKCAESPLQTFAAPVIARSESRHGLTTTA